MINLFKKKFGELFILSLCVYNWIDAVRFIASHGINPASNYDYITLIALPVTLTVGICILYCAFVCKKCWNSYPRCYKSLQETCYERDKKYT